MRRLGLTALVLVTTLAVPIFSPAPEASAKDDVLTSVWTASSYQNVFADDTAPPGASNKLDLVAARNEFESGQLLIRKTAGFTIEQVRFSSLTGSAGSIDPANLSYRFVEFEHLKANSTFAGSQPITNPVRKAPGEFPDALGNNPSIEVQPNTTQPIWVRTYVPKGTKPGTYKGKATVVTSRGDSTVDLTLRVGAATVPDAAKSNFTTDFWMLQYGSLSWDEGAGDTIELFYGHKQLSPQWWQLMEEFARSMRENRHNTLQLNLVRLLIDGGTKVDAQGKYIFNWSRFDKFAQFFIDRGVVKQLEGFWMAGPNVHGDPYPQVEIINRELKRDYAHWDGPEATNFVDQVVPALRDHIKARGWESKWWMHVGDEPHGAETVRMHHSLADRFHQLWPGVRLADAVVDWGAAQQVADRQDFLIPNELTLNEHEQFYADQLAKGKQVWLYNCNVPTYNYLNRFIDQPVWNQRSTMWYAYSRNLSGYLHWAYNNWQYKMDDQEVRGDGWITKPDKENNKLKGTIRLESLRDGLEERELLELVGKKNPVLAKNLADSIVSKANRYSRDAAYLQRIRNLLVDVASGNQAIPGDLAKGKQLDASGVIDLGSQAQVDAVRLHGATAGATIETSYDGTKWAKVHASDKATEFAGLNVKARYVRVTAAGLTGIEVAGFTLARPNLAAGKSYVKPDGIATGYEDAGDGESVDGVLAGHYGDGRSYAYQVPAGSTQTYDVTVDLGSVQQVDQVRVHKYEEFERAFYAPDSVKIAVSEDGKSYKQKAALAIPNGADGVWYDVQFPVSSARYVKVTYTKKHSPTTDMVFLDEIEAYGPAQNALVNVAEGKPYVKSAAPDDPFYLDADSKEATDGQLGGDYRDGLGYAYYLGKEKRRTISVTIDLQGPKVISQVQLQRYFDGFHQYAPDRVAVSVKPPTGGFQPVGQVAWPTGNWYDVRFREVEATAVRVDVTKADGVLADYLFLDEIAVLGDLAKSPKNLVAGAAYTKSDGLDPSYLDKDGKESTDGILAGHYSDGKSYAYQLNADETRTVNIDFDLGEPRTISMGRFRQYFDGQHNYAPDQVALLTSDDGTTWTERAKVTTALERWFDLGVPAVKARYVRFAATKKYGWFAEYIFVDELEIYGR